MNNVTGIAVAICLTALTTFAAHGLGQDKQATDPPTGQELLDAFIQAYEAEDWVEAITLARTLTEKAHENPLPPYLLANAYARASDRKAALDALEEAARRGWTSVDEIEANDDLVLLRDDPRYREILQLVAANERNSRQEYLSRAEESQAVIRSPAGDSVGSDDLILVVLHGYGGRAEKTADRWQPLSNEAGTLLVAPRAVRSAGTGFAWMDFEETAHLVDRAIEQALESISGRKPDVIVAGFSEGADMALRLALRSPTRFRGVIALAADPGLADLDLDTAASAGLRVYLVAGDEDPNLEANREAFATLRSAGVQAEQRVVPGLGHSFPHANLGVLREALAYVAQGVGRAEAQLLEAEPGPGAVMTSFLTAFVASDYDTCRSLLATGATITITRRYQGGPFERQHLEARHWLEEVEATGVKQIADFAVDIHETAVLQHAHGATAVLRFTATGDTGRGSFVNNGFDTGSLIETPEGWRIVHYSSFEDFQWNAAE